jgi:hypothetical protein
LERGGSSVVGCGLAGFYYLMFMCGSTCFGRFLAHYQELTIALAASGFYCWSMAVAALLVVVWQVFIT